MFVDNGIQRSRGLSLEFHGLTLVPKQNQQLNVALTLLFSQSGEEEPAKYVMKSCPQCSRHATDDTFVYCRYDGARLLENIDSFSTERTVALDSKAARASSHVEEQPI